LKFVKLILFITPLVFVTSCEKVTLFQDKPIYLSCKGIVDRGIVGNGLVHQSVEIIKNEITLNIKKNKIDVKGDGTQLEFLSEKTICSNDEEIKFQSNDCESPSQQIERLKKTYQDEFVKVTEQKDYEDHHKVFGLYNKINKSLFIFREDSLCYKDFKSNSCGLYTEGKYQCELVKNLN